MSADPAARGSASAPLRRFFAAARGAGVRLSPAESIDAVRAVEVVGYADRAVLRDTLGLVLAKTPEEKAALAECFDLYFRRDDLAGVETSEASGADDPVPSPEGAAEGLGRMLLAGDAAALAAAMEAAGEAAGLPNIRFFTQRNLYARRLLDHMGLRAVEHEIAALEDAGDPAATRLEAAVGALRGQVRDFVERNLLLFARGDTEAFREELLKSTRLSNLDRRDYARMQVLVRAIAKKLAARYARPRRRQLRGQLDIRRTMRRNMGWGGIPFITAWKEKRIDKPRVIVLCDVSGSVAAMAQFLLMFLYALNEALADIRSFAFAGSLIEVSAILEGAPIEAAIAEILRIIGFGSSNYGNALADFEDGWMGIVDRKTTVLVLGDARGNRTDPRVDVLARIASRAKRVIWLNPEYRSAWGTGDSDMFRYAPHCQMVRGCSTLRDLERVVTDLLEMTR
ncbi:MAG: VWA domain-containing protein [Proteobacteria bacterium]|nr:VWA domain-containing protein [Pseudomonadota bacterium]